MMNIQHHLQTRIQTPQKPPAERLLKYSGIPAHVHEWKTYYCAGEGEACRAAHTHTPADRCAEDTSSSTASIHQPASAQPRMPTVASHNREAGSSRDNDSAPAAWGRVNMLRATVCTMQTPVHQQHKRHSKVSDSVNRYLDETHDIRTLLEQEKLTQQNVCMYACRRCIYHCDILTTVSLCTRVEYIHMRRCGLSLFQYVYLPVFHSMQVHEYAHTLACMYAIIHERMSTWDVLKYVCKHACMHTHKDLVHVHEVRFVRVCTRLRDVTHTHARVFTWNAQTYIKHAHLCKSVNVHNAKGVMLVVTTRMYFTLIVTAFRVYTCNTKYSWRECRRRTRSRGIAYAYTIH